MPDRADSPDELVEGILVVDKPAGITSHDVVSRVRRLAGTRRVGHAGTLDPMATGVLILGIRRATRLLGYIAGTEKAYTATIRLGQSSTTDDAMGACIPGADASGLDMADIEEVIETLSGAILQRPSSVSAVKVNGRRGYQRARAGENFQLPARRVFVRAFDVLASRPDPAAKVLDLDVEVTCSAGTYIRALARDLGSALGVGGHLTALRRVSVGGFEAIEAQDLEELESDPSALPAVVMSLAEAASAEFPVVSVSDEVAEDVLHGRPVDFSDVWQPYRDIATEEDESDRWTELAGEHAVFDLAGRFLALVTPNPDGSTRYLAVFD